MSRMRQLVSCYLTLCLLGGGTVALNPVLHLWIEHGGHGPMHYHAGGAIHAAHPQPQRHAEGPNCDPALVQPPPAGRFVHAGEPFGLPKIALRLWHALADLFVTASSDDTPAENGPAHNHDSIFQLLAAGLVEPSTCAPGLPRAPGLTARAFATADTRDIIKDWDAQSASRAPPTARS
jgi:hypothetical protein